MPKQYQPWMEAKNKDKKENDPVNHPNHYQLENGMEVLDIIKDRLGPEGFKAYCEGNVIKYMLRSRYKGKYEEDVSKAIFYAKEITSDAGRVPDPRKEENEPMILTDAGKGTYPCPYP